MTSWAALKTTPGAWQGVIWRKFDRSRRRRARCGCVSWPTVFSRLSARHRHSLWRHPSLRQQRSALHGNAKSSSRREWLMEIDTHKTCEARSGQRILRADLPSSIFKIKQTPLTLASHVPFPPENGFCPAPPLPAIFSRVLRGAPDLTKLFITRLINFKLKDILNQ